jgi:hypothetical protein
MSLGFYETLLSLNADGTALTAAARASMTQGASATGARYSLPPNRLKIGDQLTLKASGRISCAVTTPGTARFDLAAGATVIFDTLAIDLNIVVKSNVSWYLDVLGTVRAIGTTGNIFWQGYWLSEANKLVPVPTTGPGPGGALVPWNTAPVVGANFDTTVTSLLDFFFTQTVATGSVTLHQLHLGLMSSSGF